MASVENPGVRSAIGQYSLEKGEKPALSAVQGVSAGRGLSNPAGASSGGTALAAPCPWSVLVLAEGALGGGCCATRGGHTIERHALDAAAGNLRPLRREGARIDAEPGNLRRQAAVFDFRAAVHHHLDAVLFGQRRRLVVADAELHPHHARARLQLDRLL